MKTRFIMTGIACLLAMVLPSTVSVAEVDPFAETSGPVKHSVVQVQVEYIEVSHEALTKLLFLSTPESSDAGPLRKRLQEMVLNNEAKVLETQLVSASTHQKATSESIQELIFPTEYDPTYGWPPFAGVSPPPQPVWPVNPAVPSAFDVRNLGSNLEADSTVSENGVIEVRLTTELLWHTGNTRWQEAKDERGNVATIQKPDFYRVITKTHLNCKSGQYTLLSVQSPADEKGRMDISRKIVILLKANVLTVK